MAVNFTPVGQEVQVNAGAVNLDQYDADAAALTNGNFAVAYTRQFNSTDDWDIYLQFVTANGTLSGDHLLIDSNAGVQVEAAVASRLGGGAVVVWTDRNGWEGVDSSSGSVDYAIQLRMVSSTGVMSAPMTVIDAALPTADPDVAMLADGRVVVAFELNQGSDYDVGIKFLNAAGTSFGDAHFVEDKAALITRDAALATSGNNVLVAFWDVPNRDIRVELFDGASGAFTTPNDVPGRLVASAGNLNAPDVAALVDGRYVVVWENLDNKHVEGRFVDAAGNPIGSVFTIANNAGHNEDARVAALPDGGFIVTWQTTGGVIAPETGTSFSVLARRFDATGGAAGDLFLVNTGDPNTQQVSPTVAVDRSTGKAFMAWTDDHSFAGVGQDNDPLGIRGHAFQATTDVVNGTPGDDTINTYSLSETINGLEGNDTINGKGGDDSVDGGPGGDILFGDIGNDTVAGSEGADTVNGDSGNDLVNGGLGNDSLTGGPDADRFVFNTAIKPKGSNVDTINDFVAADDTILLDNAIFTKLKSEGVLAAKFFEVGKKAHDKNDFIDYNNKTGDLLYDKNGDKKGGALLFAHLEGSPDDVSAADFLVV